MRSLVRLFALVVGVGLATWWWWAMQHLKPSPGFGVGILQAIGVCLLFVCAALFLVVALVSGKRTMTPIRMPPQRAARPALPQLTCERCNRLAATMYSRKRDLMCCDPCAFAVTMPLSDLTTVIDGIGIRAARGADEGRGEHDQTGR